MIPNTKNMIDDKTNVFNLKLFIMFTIYGTMILPLWPKPSISAIAVDLIYTYKI